MKSLDFILGVWGSHWRVLNQDVIWVQVQSIFTHAHCFETHYYLRTARTIVLVLQMRKLRLTLIQSLPWAHTITGRAGTIKPTSSDSQSLMQHCFLIFSCEWMNVCISRSCSWYGTHQSQGPKSRLRCILPPRLRLATLLCLPRVFSDHSVRVYVSSLFPDGWRNPDVVSLITPTWAVGGETSATPWLDRSGGRNTSPTGALTLSLFLPGFGYTLTIFPDLSFRGSYCGWVWDQGEDQGLKAYDFVLLVVSRGCCVSNFRFI